MAAGLMGALVDDCCLTRVMMKILSMVIMLSSGILGFRLGDWWREFSVLVLLYRQIRQEQCGTSYLRIKIQNLVDFELSTKVKVIHFIESTHLWE